MREMVANKHLSDQYWTSPPKRTQKWPKKDPKRTQTFIWNNWHWQDDLVRLTCVPSSRTIVTSLKSLNSLSLRKVPSHSHKLKRYCNYQYSLAVQRSHPIPSFRFECSKLIWMVLAIPGRSVGSYWTPVGGHGRSLGGYEILVMGGIYLGVFWKHLWWYLVDILRYIGDIKETTEGIS